MNWRNHIVSADPETFEVGNIWSRGDNLLRITDDFLALLQGLDFAAIAAIEMKGVIYGAALAARTGLPLTVFRKKGKLHPGCPKISRDFTNWKGEPDGIEVEAEFLTRAASCIVVDDLAQSLQTFKAVTSLFAESSNRLAAFLCFANLSGEKKLGDTALLSLL